MPLSNYLKDELNDHWLGTGSYTSPTVYLALHDDAPGGTGSNELSGGSYARQECTFDASASGTADNTSAESWDLTGVTDGEYGFVGLFDAVSAGNFLAWYPIGGTPFTFTAEDTGDVFTSYDHTLANDDRVILRIAGGSALPTGVSEDTVYWVVGVSGDTFQLSATQGGGAIALTADGEGIALFVDFKSFSGGDTADLAAGALDISLT